MCITRYFSEKIAYTALGHIHKAQRVSGRENVRYAGSPIPMSFAEKHYHHGVVMVILDEGCAVDIRRIECPQSIPLISVPGGEAASPGKNNRNIKRFTGGGWRSSLSGSQGFA